jgi:P27 family predicted phage terminase small subunit
MPGEAGRPAPVLALPGGRAPASTAPAPPDDLPAAAVPVWEQAVAELEPMGLRPADLEAIRLMCVAACRARQAAASIDQYGLLVKGERGPMVNPMARLERDATMTYLRLAEQFGLTLASRMRLGLMVLAGESLVAELNRDLDG